MNLCRFGGGYYSISAESDFFLFHMNATGKIRLDKKKWHQTNVRKGHLFRSALSIFFCLRTKYVKGEVKKEADALKTVWERIWVMWARIYHIEVVDFLKLFFSLSTIFQIVFPISVFNSTFSFLISTFISNAPDLWGVKEKIERRFPLTRVILKFILLMSSFNLKQKNPNTHISTALPCIGLTKIEILKKKQFNYREDEIQIESLRKFEKQSSNKRTVNM